MNTRVNIVRTPFTVAGLLAVAALVGIEQKSFAAAAPTDSVHAAHVASGAMPPDAAKGDPALVRQLSQLQAKVAQLEAALARIAPPITAAPAGAPMPGMPGAAPAASAPMGMGMGKMKPAAAMPRMSGGAAPAPPMAGMSGGMGMDKMEMAGMMGTMGMGWMVGGNAMPQSALPGFPGASHLYHIGATGFFLDHPQHIALTTQQQAALNQAKEQAALSKSTADRAVKQAEQELWMLTAADQPDAAKIEAKLAEIGKLRADERLSFIRAVGDASKILTDEQRKILTGFAPPVSAVPAAAPMPPMKDM